MKDFIGNTINIGDFVAYPGAGNVKAEYGMLLKKVKKIHENAITVEGLDVEYDGEDIKIKRRNSKITNCNKVVVINPPPYINIFFDHPEDYPKQIGEWIHGKMTFDEIFNS